MGNPWEGRDEQEMTQETNPGQHGESYPIRDEDEKVKHVGHG